jgi:hypothetical protein
MLLAIPALADSPAEAPWLSRRIDPTWASVAPARTLRIGHDPGKTDEANGAVLAQTIDRLEPGDKLLIGPGRYSFAAKFTLDLAATAERPIWIEGADPERLPVITRPDARQNVINLGERSAAQYLCLRHLELTGGSTLIRIYDGHHLWIDRCHLHHAGAEGITANARDTSHLFITGNHLHDFLQPKATGEALYLGGNHAKAVMSYSVIADNHIHDCSGQQGDGIEVKQGSHHNWIVRNHVHDTKYPAITVYGTGGNGINVIEQNLCYRSEDNGIQVQGEAIVRNNLIMAAKGAGFASTDHQGQTTDLSFVHNTIITRGRGVNLTSWNGRANMVFANNAVYTDGGQALRFPGGSQGVTVAGNVIVGQAQGIRDGFTSGKGLSDFAKVSWDATQRSAIPTPGSPLIGAADDRHLVESDLSGKQRGGSKVVGAVDAPR